MELHDILNIVFLVGFAYLYWLYRNQDRLGGGAGFALDPVCGMQVQVFNAPAHTVRDGRDYWFCSDPGPPMTRRTMTRRMRGRMQNLAGVLVIVVGAGSHAGRHVRMAVHDAPAWLRLRRSVA